MANINYRPDIDGLRTLAVLPVVLFHSNPAWAPGGYVGVDIFFVISGYLITRIIQGDIEKQRFSIINFYERRARRILPALFLILAFCIVVGWLWFMPADFDTMAKSAIATVGFLSNIRFMMSFGNYFAGSTEVEPLLHTWSLAVEEQFYIVFPLLMWAVARFLPGNKRFNATAIIAGISFLSLAYAIWLLPHDSVRAFYLPFTRAWELGLGALIAVRAVPRLTSTPSRQAVAAIGLALIVMPILMYVPETPFPGLAAVPPVLGTALIIWAGEAGGSIVATALALRPMVWIGRLSYSLYLWHWPILVFVRYRFATELWPIWWPLPLIVAMIAISYLTYRFIENPFRARDGVTRKGIFGGAVAGSATFALIAGLIVWQHGVYQRFEPSVVRVAKGVMDVDRSPGKCSKDLATGQRLCVLGAPGVTPDFFIWGDSHARTAAVGIDVAAKAAGRAGYLWTRSACVPFLEISRPKKRNCPKQNAQAQRILLAHREIKDVILVSRWAFYFHGSGSTSDEETDVPLRDWSHAGAREPNALVFRRGLTRTVNFLRANGRHVLVLQDVPEIGWIVPQYEGVKAAFGTPTPQRPTLADYQSRNGAVNDMLQQMAARGMIDTISSSDLLCEQTCRTMYRGRPLYVDDNHLTKSGSKLVFGDSIQRYLARSK